MLKNLYLIAGCNGAGIIVRRYNNGIKNLFTIYLPIVDESMIFDNSGGMPDLIAEKAKNSELNIINITKFDKLKNIV